MGNNMGFIKISYINNMGFNNINHINIMDFININHINNMFFIVSLTIIEAGVCSAGFTTQQLP